MFVRRVVAIVSVACIALAVGAGCGGSDENSSQSTADEQPATSTKQASVDLASVCPNPLVVQLNWYPQPDPYAVLFGLIGSGGKTDKERGTYSGPATADPKLTIEIRGGGPLVGFQQVFSLMYTDRSIFLGDVSVDRQLSGQKKYPTVGVFAPFEKSPRILMFNPDTGWKTIEDIKNSGKTVLVAPNAIYWQSLVQQGKLTKQQIDTSWDGSPARFVTEGGKIAQQGFSTAEPYVYENEIPAWKKPVDFLSMHDAGFPNYENSIVVRKEDVKGRAECLKRLVPLMQQSMVDYMKSPDATNKLISDLAKELKSPSAPSVKAAAYATQAMKSQGLVSNGENDTYGDYDDQRVQELIDLLKPVSTNNANFDPDVTPSSAVTNKFLDQSIGMPR